MNDQHLTSRYPSRSSCLLLLLLIHASSISSYPFVTYLSCDLRLHSLYEIINSCPSLYPHDPSHVLYTESYVSYDSHLLVLHLILRSSSTLSSQEYYHPSRRLLS